MQEDDHFCKREVLAALMKSVSLHMLLLITVSVTLVHSGNVVARTHNDCDRHVRHCQSHSCHHHSHKGNCSRTRSKLKSQEEGERKSIVDTVVHIHKTIPCPPCPEPLRFKCPQGYRPDTVNGEVTCTPLNPDLPLPKKDTCEPWEIKVCLSDSEYICIDTNSQPPTGTDPIRWEHRGYNVNVNGQWFRLAVRGENVHIGRWLTKPNEPAYPLERWRKQIQYKGIKPIQQCEICSKR